LYKLFKNSISQSEHALTKIYSMAAGLIQVGLYPSLSTFM